MNKFALTTVAGIPSNGASAFVKPEVGKAREPEAEPWVVMEFDGPDLTQNVEMNPVKVEVVERYHKDTKQIAFEYDKAVLSYDGTTQIVEEKKRHLGKMLKHAEMYGAGPEAIKRLAKLAGSDQDAARYSQASREADLAAVKAAFERGEEIEWMLSGEQLGKGFVDTPWVTASKALGSKLGFTNAPEFYRIKAKPDPYRHLKEAWKAGKTIQFKHGGVWNDITDGKEPEWCFGPECYRARPSTLSDVLNERPTTAELIAQKQRDRKEAQSRFDRDYPGPLWVAKDGRALPVSKMETSHLINAYNYVKKVSRTSHIQGLTAETWRKLFDEELDKRYSEKRRDGSCVARL